MCYQQAKGRTDYSHLSVTMHFQKTNATVNNVFFKGDCIDGSPLREQNAAPGKPALWGTPVPKHRSACQGGSHLNQQLPSNKLVQERLGIHKNSLQLCLF